MKRTQTRAFEDKIDSYMREHHMLRPGDRVVAGVSGGADSVCLLFVLLKWRERYGLDVAAVHVNHGVRAEAGEDARFVEELCGRQGVPFYLREADVDRLAKEWKCSGEEAGRIVRYRAFRDAAADFGAYRIAVAHNLNDRSETMLFHLFRGTGLKGLAGIPPVRDQIIRPLLCVQRDEIEHYLEEIGQDYCRDATNGEDLYTRNRIRHHILPYAEQEVEGCLRHMGQTAELVAEAEEYLGRQTAEALAACTEDGGNCRVIDCGAFEAFHPAIRKRMLHELIRSLAPGAGDIFRIHVEELNDLCLREGNRTVCLPFGIRGRREYGRVFLGRGEGTGEPSCGERRAEDAHVAFQVLSAKDLPRNDENSVIFPENEYTKWFDYDKIIESPVLRTRAEGDYLTIRDGGGALCHKKLKEYMVTEKIPRGLRDQVLLLAEGSHVLWLVGYRISEYYKVSGNTKRVLQVQLLKGCGGSSTEEENGRTCESSFVGE